MIRMTRKKAPKPVPEEGTLVAVGAPTSLVRLDASVAGAVVPFPLVPFVPKVLNALGKTNANKFAIKCIDDDAFGQIYIAHFADELFSPASRNRVFLSWVNGNTIKGRMKPDWLSTIIWNIVFANVHLEMDETYVSLWNSDALEIRSSDLGTEACKSISRFASMACNRGLLSIISKTKERQHMSWKGSLLESTTVNKHAVLFMFLQFYAQVKGPRGECALVDALSRVRLAIMQQHMTCLLAFNESPLYRIWDLCNICIENLSMPVGKTQLRELLNVYEWWVWKGIPTAAPNVDVYKFL